MSAGNYIVDGDDGSHWMSSSSKDYRFTEEEEAEAREETRKEFWDHYHKDMIEYVVYFTENPHLWDREENMNYLIKCK
jgi:hypothetical protein